MKVPEGQHTTRVLLDRAIEQDLPRPHLGASLLGHHCERYLWLTFRWVVRVTHNPRTLRIFRRGHNEEATIIGDLRRVGIDVSECLNRQKFIDFGWHVGGSPDGVCHGVPEAQRTAHILECKTHNDASFKAIVKGGVISKPLHWTQAHCYMFGRGMDRTLYYAVNKNDDDIYIERIRLDKEIATKAIERGHSVTKSDRLPPPISTDKTWWQCKCCDFYGFCHGDTLPQVNCRTCAHCTIREHDIYCERWESPIPVDGQRVGCRSHVIHPDLVPWEMEEFDQWNCRYNGRVVGEDGISSIELLHGEVVAMVVEETRGEIV